MARIIVTTKRAAMAMASTTTKTARKMVRVSVLLLPLLLPLLLLAAEVLQTPETVEVVQRTNV